jgi:hypothetical protein
MNKSIKAKQGASAHKPQTAAKGQGFDAVLAYPVGPSPETAPAQLQAISHPQDGVVQLKAWEWKKATATWAEVDAAEKGKAVPGHVTGDADGEVYDADTEKWYKTVEDYRRYTGRIANPVFQSTPQDPMDLMGLMAKQGKGIAPLPGAGDKLHSFLKGGVMLPSSLGGKVTYSADEKERPDQISVNKFGPFASQQEAAQVAHYAALNPANGAVPVAMENNADVLGPKDEPDLQALATRAHNSALAIIDPTGLPGAMHPDIKLAGQGELTLRSSIPSSCFVAVLMPIALMRLVSEADVKRFNIRFVGSVQAGLSFNFRSSDRSKSKMQVATSVPDYESALAQIFAANAESIFLTHVIRMSPPDKIATQQRGSAKAAASAEESGAAVSSVNAAKATASSPASAAASHDVSSAPAALEAPSAMAAPAHAGQNEQELRAIAGKICTLHPDIYDIADADITTPAALLTAHAAQGVTKENAAALFEILSDAGIWMC